MIIDEAHNVLETIAHIHSAEVSQTHLEHAKEQLKNYFNKFKNMLKAKNLLYIKQLKLVLAKLNSCVKNQQDSKLMHFGDFLMEMDNFDNVNLLFYATRKTIFRRASDIYQSLLAILE